MFRTTSTGGKLAIAMAMSPWVDHSVKRPRLIDSIATEYC